MRLGRWRLRVAAMIAGGAFVMTVTACDLSPTAAADGLPQSRIDSPAPVVTARPVSDVVTAAPVSGSRDDELRNSASSARTGN